MRKIIVVLSILLGFICNAFTQENVQIRTDRDIYVIGEAVWLELNCFDYENKIVNGASKVVYVELLNAANNPVQQLKVYLENGKATTRMVLSDSISTGNYLLRAYTHWMRNYDETLFAYQLISVINPFVSKRFPASDKTFATDTLIVNAESNLVLQNFENNLLLRSYNKKGVATQLEGIVEGPNGDSVTFIQTSDTGLAYIEFKPEQTGNYTYNIAADDDQILKIPFVTVQNEGVVLSLIDESTFDIQFKVKSNAPINKGKLHIVTEKGRFILSEKIGKNANGIIYINKSELPKGILIARIVDADKKVLAGRYFVANAGAKNACTVQCDKDNYGIRDKVNLTVGNSFNLNNVSVSVVKSSLLSDPIPFYSDLWLNLLDVGKIMKRYGNELSLNNLLLAVNPQKALVKNMNFNQFAELKGEIISGSIVNNTTNKPIVNETFLLGFVSDKPYVYLSTTDEEGRFKFVVNEFEEQDMVIQPLNHNDSILDYHIDLDASFCERYHRWKAPFILNEKRIEEINKSIVGMQVNVLYERYLSYKNLPTTRHKSESFYGEPLYSTTIGKFIDLPNMEEVFNEIVDVVYLRKHDGKLKFQVVDSRVSPHQKEDVFMMIDGIPVWSSEEILKLNPESIRLIEVVNLNYFLKENNLGYILSVFTNDGDLSAYNFDERIFRQSRKCYTHNYQFDGPDYAKDSTGFERIPDFRNMLYRKSDLQFDQNYQSKLSFYTSDEKGDYTIIVEGFNQFGKLERVEVPFVVK